MTWSRLPLGIAALGIIGCAIGLVLVPVELARAWLVATTTLMGLPLGAMVLLMLFVLTGGRWGAAARPALTAMAMTLPAMLLLFLPLLGAIPALLPFVAATPDTLPERVVGKLTYLAPGWIVLRTLVVFALWLVSALLLPIAPVLLQAYGGGSRSEVCKCCRRKDHRGCHMSDAAASTGGPSWSASSSCESGCGQQGFLAFSPSFLAPQKTRVPRAAPRVSGVDVTCRSHASTSYAAW